MMTTLSRWRDQLLGRGEAAITIPIFDGALKPNRILEDAKVAAHMPAAEDLATDGKNLFVADGLRVLRVSRSKSEEVARFDRRLIALACLPDGGFAVALDSGEVRIAGGNHDGRRWDNVDGRPLLATNAISVRRNGRLLLSDGSATYEYDRWCHDLMSRGKTGRLVEINPVDGSARQLASNLAFAYGACEAGGAAWVCESWRHRMLKIEEGGAVDALLDELPGYPSRIAAASDGGFWVTVFTGRTQLIEFVLREPKYCKRMMAEVDPRYWIAPALSSGKSFLEPLQGAGVKMRGVVKPWAPPRSYGLVIKLSAAGSVEYSFHSRLDGEHHGIVAAVECGPSLFVLSKGSGRILELPVAESERLVQQ